MYLPPATSEAGKSRSMLPPAATTSTRRYPCVTAREMGCHSPGGILAGGSVITRLPREEGEEWTGTMSRSASEALDLYPFAIVKKFNRSDLCWGAADLKDGQERPSAALHTHAVYMDVCLNCFLRGRDGCEAAVARLRTTRAILRSALWCPRAIVIVRLQCQRSILAPSCTLPSSAHSPTTPLSRPSSRYACPSYFPNVTNAQHQTLYRISQHASTARGEGPPNSSLLYHTRTSSRTQQHGDRWFAHQGAQNAALGSGGEPGGGDLTTSRAVLFIHPPPHGH
ncbi:hypothetical protein C8Q80DRAFT_857182 [Daedaleopsis nitida]|nr:hypothetical protein C8Q80DRAFT_857182 [Daedaleopsis nitida]